MWEMKNLISTYMTRRSNKKTARLTPEVDTRGLCITSVMNCQGHSLGERIFWGDSRCIKGRGIFLPASTPRAVKEVNPPPSLPLPASSPCFEWRAPPRQSASPSWSKAWQSKPAGFKKLPSGVWWRRRSTTGGNIYSNGEINNEVNIPGQKNMRKSSLFCPLSSLRVAPARGVGPACSLILSIYEGWTWQSTTGASLPSSTSTRQTTRMSSEVTKRFSSGEDLLLDTVDSRNTQVAYRNICEFHICAWRYIQTNKSDAVAFHFLAFYSFIISKELMQDFWLTGMRHLINSFKLRKWDKWNFTNSFGTWIFGVLHNWKISIV